MTRIPCTGIGNSRIRFHVGPLAKEMYSVNALPGHKLGHVCTSRWTFLG